VRFGKLLSVEAGTHRQAVQQRVAPDFAKSLHQIESRNRKTGELKRYFAGGKFWWP
jgi:hypothetical protein